MVEYLILVLCLLIGYFLIVKQMSWLTTLGFLSAIILAITIYYSLGLSFLLHPFIFLVSGSLLSKISKDTDVYNDSSGRGFWQVFSNGGIAFFCCLIVFYIDRATIEHAFILSFAIATSDTWSSEIGRTFGGQPFDLIKWAKVEKGISGGVSWAGTVGGILGSFLISFLAYYFEHLTFISAIFIGMLGVIGMLVDSVFGSLFQAKYLVNNTVTEKGSPHQLIGGFHWITNNKVNFLSISIIVFFYLIFAIC